MKLFVLASLVVLAASHGHHHDEDKYKKDETLSAQYDPHVQFFKAVLDGLMEARPTGRPDFDDILKSVEEKYKEAKENLKSAAPSEHGHHYDHEYKKAYDQLKKHKDEVKHKVEEWKCQMKEEAKKQIAAQYNPHIQSFKDEFDDLMQARPTGRPDFDDILKSVEEKYKEAKENLKSVTPSEHGHHHDHEYKKAYDQLKKHKNEIKHKVEEWKWQMKEEAKKQIAAQYNPHVQSFKDEFDDLMQARPTGRPDFDDILKSLEEKYKEAKENLKSVTPSEHGHHHDHEYKKAYDQLKKHKYQVKHKVEEWKWQMKEEEKKQEAAQRKAAIDALVKDFDPLNDDLYLTKPTGRPEFEDLYKKIKAKYEEAKENLKNHGESSKHGHKHHDLKKAYDQLYEKNEEVKKIVEGWRKQVRQDKMNAALAGSPFGSAIDSFYNGFQNAFAGRPTGRPDVRKFMKALEKHYHGAKKILSDLRPTGRPSKGGDRLYNVAHKQLKNYYYDAWEKVEAWKKQVDAAKHKEHKHEHDKHKKHH